MSPKRKNKRSRSLFISGLPCMKFTQKIQKCLVFWLNFFVVSGLKWGHSGFSDISVVAHCPCSRAEQSTRNLHWKMQQSGGSQRKKREWGEVPRDLEYIDRIIEYLSSWSLYCGIETALPVKSSHVINPSARKRISAVSEFLIPPVTAQDSNPVLPKLSLSDEWRITQSSSHKSLHDLQC